MNYDGFSSYLATDALWAVSFERKTSAGGTVFVHAPSEAIALQRFMSKYPDANVRSIKRK